MTAAMKNIAGWAFPSADEFMIRELKPDGTYQVGHLNAALTYVTDYSCALDVGAHVGTWSKRLAAVFDRVIAVEPSPDTFEALSVNMRRFNVQNVALRNIALGASRGSVSMHLDARNAERKNTGARYVQSGGTIPCETIDGWNLLELGFLKLDVEGSEPAVLDGAVLTLARCRPIVLFENKNFWQQRYGKAKDAPHVLLTGVGYRHLQTVGHDEIWGAA